MSRKKARRAREDRPVKQAAALAGVAVPRFWAGGLWSLLLVAAMLGAYWPALRGDFVFDDLYWTTGVEKLLRDFSGLWQIWTRPTALQQYYPLTGTSFWLDYQLWHWWTLPYHVENVLLHASCALLLWRLLRKLEVPGAWLAGALFALHPVMVESTAWITERKNVLSMLLFLAALLAYGRFSSFWVETAAEPGRRRRAWMYALALVLFLGALLSKITAVALPPVLLLLCWWKRGSIRWKQDVLPTLPFFVLSIGLGLVVAWLEKHHVGAQGADWELSWAERILVAGRVPWFYLGKLLLPVHQSLIYPQWRLDAGSLWQWMYPLGAVAVLVMAWWFRRRIGRGPVVALFYFAGTLFPVLGLMNFYWTRYSFVGDHLVYLSSPAVLALIVAVVVRAAQRLGRPVLVRGFALVVLPLFAALTWREAGQYQDAETLWRTTIARNPACWLAHYNLSDALLQKGQANEAMAHCQKSLELKPDFPEAHNNLGNAFLQKGQVDEAIVHYQRAMELKPDDAAAHNNLGAAILQTGQIDVAMTHFQRALELKPEYAAAHNNLGESLLRSGHMDEAIVHYRKALEIKPDDAETHFNLGNALLEMGQVDETIVHYRRALELKPEYVAAHNNLGTALLRRGQVDEALVQYRRALEIKPDFAEAHNNLGEALLQKGQVDEAMIHYHRALELNPDYAGAHYNLGNALRAAGRVDEAISQFELAIKINPMELGALNNLAWTLATSPEPSQRNGARALELAQRASGLSGGNHPMVEHALAAAYAECGRFAEAAAGAERALSLAIAQGNSGLAEIIRKERSLYEAGQPVREIQPVVPAAP